MAPTERRNLSLSHRAARLLDELCDIEQVGQTTLLERALETRLGLIDISLRVPRDERGRLVRMAVLPESAEAPPGAQVFRMYVPLPASEEPELGGRTVAPESVPAPAPDPEPAPAEA